MYWVILGIQQRLFDCISNVAMSHYKAFDYPVLLLNYTQFQDLKTWWSNETTGNANELPRPWVQRIADSLYISNNGILWFIFDGETLLNC